MEFALCPAVPLVEEAPGAAPRDAEARLLRVPGVKERVVGAAGGEETPGRAPVLKDGWRGRRGGGDKESSLLWFSAAPPPPGSLGVDVSLFLVGAEV